MQDKSNQTLPSMQAVRPELSGEDMQLAIELRNLLAKYGKDKERIYRVLSMVRTDNL